MDALLLDIPELGRLIEERREKGADRWDEMWEGVLHMVPPPQSGHQSLLTDLIVVLGLVIREPGLGKVLPGVKVAERAEQEDNFRVPDISVVLKRSKARVKRQGIEGGPDFVVEIYSPGDETYKKLDYYGKLGVRELLVVHRDTKALELYRLSGRKLRKVEETPGTVESRVLPLTFTRVGRRRPYRVRVEHARTGQQWMIG